MQLVAERPSTVTIQAQMNYIVDTGTPPVRYIDWPEMAHKEIPGNPSTAKSSQLKLNDRSNGKPLRLLSEEEWNFWIFNGYVVIRNAVPKEQVKKLADYLWEYEDKNPDDMDSWYKRPNVQMEMKAASSVCERRNAFCSRKGNHQPLMISP
jgi:hypothetical protein